MKHATAIKGALLVALSAILFALYPIVAKYAYANGATAPALLLFMATGVFPLGLIGFLDKRIDMRINVKQDLKKIVLLGALGMVATPMLLLAAYQHISAGTATVIHYLYCVVTLLLCVLLYKEPFDWVKALCVGLSMLGVVLLYAPDASGAKTGFLLAFLSACTYAFYGVYLQKSGLDGRHPIQLQFYFNVVLFLFAVPYSILAGAFPITMTPTAIVVVLLYYSVGATLAAILYQTGIHLVGPQTTTILSTIEPLTSALLGILLFQELLNIKTAVGILVILAAAVIVTLAALRQQPSKT